MAFELNEVIQILKINEQVPKWIQVSREKHKTLRALIDGDDFKSELSKIEHIEKSEKKWQVRQKYSRSIKDLNQRLLRPVDNVYSATGGSKNYNLTGDKLKTLLDKLSNVRGNKSLEQWLETNWMHVYHNDPDGVIFIEYTTEETEDCWPTYKEITKIRNYEKDGQSLNWILFEPKKVIDPVTKEPTEFIRFVDDKTDYTFKRSGSNYTLIEDKTFDHPFGRVPGLVNSDIEKLGVYNALTPIDAIVEPEKEYLRDQSIKTIHKFIRGLPIFWRYKMLCPTCHGTLKDGTGDCRSCDNTGFKMDSDISDEVVLPVPTDKDEVKLAPDIAGWLTPPKDILEEMNEELSTLEVSMYESHWGSHKSELTSGTKTIIEIWADEQPVMSRLNKYGDVGEWVEQYLTELIANFLFPTKDKNENVSSIHYGRNYIIQPPEYLLEEYHKSKENSDGVTILDRKLGEYLTSKYKNDPVALRIEILKAHLEPFVHYTIDLVKEVFGVDAAKKKMLFGDWWETLTYETFEKKTDDALENDMNTFINNKLTEFKDSQIIQDGENSSS
jgi:hypothetical protein